MTNSFYVSLPSNKTDEYPNNTNNDFKVRLPTRIPLTGDNWKVGLVGVVLPNIPLFEDLYKINGPFFSVQFSIKNLDDSTSLPSPITVNTQELKTYVEEGSIVDGEGLMNFIRNTLREKATELIGLNKEIVPEDWLEFVWKTNSGSKPVLTLGQTKRKVGRYALAKIHKDLAVTMGWLQRDGSRWKLGHNLLAIPYPIPSDRASRSTGYTGNALFQVSGDWMSLSKQFTWEFSNLNEIVFRKKNL